jgi:hypothetical protein
MPAVRNASSLPLRTATRARRLATNAQPQQAACIGAHLGKSRARAFPQVVGEEFKGANKERCRTDFKVLLPRDDVGAPRDRELLAHFLCVMRRVIRSGNVTSEAELPKGCHPDRLWAIVLARQRQPGSEREPGWR